MEAYSVLMTVYHGENPEQFDMAIRSMLDQTYRTDDFTIVCDGPLTSELELVLERYTREYPELFQLVRLPENVGIGEANNAGLKYCKNDLVAKMDADDIAVPDRCEKQVARFRDNPKLAVLGGIIEEFDQDPLTPFAVRHVPAEYEEIRKFARRRQPFNNTTVMYRRSAVVAVGGYRKLRRCEDYDLYIRLLHGGMRAENLRDVLVKVRVDNGACSRRASMSTLHGVIHSRWHAFRLGYSSLLDFLICTMGELVILVCPSGVQQFIYNSFLRQHRR